MTTLQIIPKRYGITERKKAELDALELDILDAQQEVEQYRAITESLSAKLDRFRSFLAIADSNRAKALSNKNLMYQLAQSAHDLLKNSDITMKSTDKAQSNTAVLAKKIKDVMDKLIYCAEMLDKLANLVVRKKALNPLISDDLVSMIGKAGTDANNAVALTLIALKSSFAAQAANMESEASASLAYLQASELYQVLVSNGNSKSQTITVLPADKDKCLSSLLNGAYATSQIVYQKMEHACDLTAEQLRHANASLNVAQARLKALQTGLAAGNAAALAS